MKKTKIIIPAMGMLLLGTAASVTGTVAWFSMNNQVQVSGMQVKTKVSNNLFIASDVIGSTAKVADSNFSGEPLSQTVKKVLEPASTLNAINFFYSVDAKADGSKNKPITGEGADPFIAYDPSAAATNTTDYSDKFSEVYGISKTGAAALITGEDRAYAYAEYVFQLKATNVGDADVNINLTELKLKYGANTDDNHAYRVAVFCQSADSTIPALAAGDKKGTWKPTSGADHNSQVVSGTAAYSSNSYVSTATPIASVAAGETHYYKVVARLWLEGQDTSCTNSTFATLTNTWSLTMQLELGTGTPVTALAMDVTE